MVVLIYESANYIFFFFFSINAFGNFSRAHKYTRIDSNDVNLCIRFEKCIQNFILF